MITFFALVSITGLSNKVTIQVSGFPESLTDKGGIQWSNLVILEHIAYPGIVVRIALIRGAAAELE